MKNKYEGTLFGVQFISGIVFVMSHTIQELFSNMIKMGVLED